MGFFPFYKFPYPNYYHPYYQHQHLKTNSNFQMPNNSSYSQEKKSSADFSKDNFKNQKKSSKSQPFTAFNISNLFSSDLEEPVIEIMGIQLYLDDLMILCLLYFLYKEKVDDEFLFIELILLLLS